MTPKEIIINQLKKNKTPRKGVGNPVSSVTVNQIEITKSYFPEAHTNAKKMFELSRAGYELLGFDTIMPYFSVVVESQAIGCKVDWGRVDIMPRIIGKLWSSYYWFCFYTKMQ
jgi:[methyl-Co(III) methanol-specific corrinoid protein]:coenzyme M methyltransferase